MISAPGPLPPSAEDAKRRVEALIAARISRSPIDAETPRWATDLPETMAARLAATGLVAVRERKVTMPLREFLHAFVEGKSRAKPATK